VAKEVRMIPTDALAKIAEVCSGESPLLPCR
jgi:hypothetical protein